MKLSGTLLQKTLGMVMITIPLALTATAEMNMRQVEIKNCASKGSPCFTVRAPEAQVSSLSPLYVMKNMTLEIDGSKKQVFQSPQGYIDFGSDQLVLQNLDGNGTLTEHVFDLNTLEQKTYVTK